MKVKFNELQEMEAIETIKDLSADFQTPVNVCKFMASLVPDGVKSVLEPTAGAGNIVRALAGYQVYSPEDFFQMKFQRFDCVVTNPPFSAKYAFGVPPGFEKHGMRLGYHILTRCMEMSDNIIALMPWFTISDSDVRLRFIKRFGLKSLTALPRKTFQYARIQTCVFEMQKGFKGETAFKVFDLLKDNKISLF
jgi:type I restriction-modification system DNA methylase subunit